MNKIVQARPSLVDQLPLVFRDHSLVRLLLSAAATVNASAK